ncbi:hypothetical protein F4818DRAFT_396554 [Hypoxylon cercidicola]|nr:hypothetical protein F4818DRAFT_396554 [Hypoxylon cercidicola]
MPGSKSKPLPSQAVTELVKVASWLQSEKADFQYVDNINICNNKEGLAKVTNDLIKQFATEITPKSSQNRVTAIHFSQSGIVPVEQGWTVYIMPVHVVGGTIMVEDQQLNLGFYCHLEENTHVSGDFFAVLLLSR